MNYCGSGSMGRRSGEPKMRRSAKSDKKRNRIQPKGEIFERFEKRSVTPTQIATLAAHTVLTFTSSVLCARVALWVVNCQQEVPWQQLQAPELRFGESESIGIGQMQ